MMYMNTRPEDDAKRFEEFGDKPSLPEPKLIATRDVEYLVIPVGDAPVFPDAELEKIDATTAGIVKLIEQTALYRSMPEITSKAQFQELYDFKQMTVKVRTGMDKLVKEAKVPAKEFIKKIDECADPIIAVAKEAQSVAQVLLDDYTRKQAEAEKAKEKAEANKIAERTQRVIDAGMAWDVLVMAYVISDDTNHFTIEAVDIKHAPDDEFDRLIVGADLVRIANEGQAFVNELIDQDNVETKEKQLEDENRRLKEQLAALQPIEDKVTPFKERENSLVSKDFRYAIDHSTGGCALESQRYFVALVDLRSMSESDYLDILNDPKNNTIAGPVDTVAVVESNISGFTSDKEEIRAFINHIEKSNLQIDSLKPELAQLLDKFESDLIILCQKYHGELNKL